MNTLLWLYAIFAMAGIAQWYALRNVASAMASATVVGLTLWGVAQWPQHDAHVSDGAFVAHVGATEFHTVDCAVVEEAVSRHDSSLRYFRTEPAASHAGRSAHICVTSTRLAGGE